MIKIPIDNSGQKRLSEQLPGADVRVKKGNPDEKCLGKAAWKKLQSWRVLGNAEQ